ncbi:PAS domain S-box-containing protein [Povalibacter uvarum]|uniref:histidine kinase n=1 Tax=Povalibacter uvarum TaxID=732238 RepID=A0A841HI89_9GAMM|nr:PAS domain S-box protein [Povalibacter uvarum]MBB6092516.1 PAS domain S-box-containing protein [Povalibacter uvarum]
MTAVSSAPPGSLAMLDAVTQGVLVVPARDFDRPAHANKAFLQLTGYEREEVLASHVLSLCSDATDADSMQQFHQALRSARACTVEIVLVARDGRAIPVRVAVQPFEGSGETPHLVLTFEDLTRVVRTRESLRTSEARLQVAMDASALSMWEWNVERDEVYYNDHWRTSLGVDPQQLLKRESLSDRLMLPSDQQSVLEQFEQHFHGATPHFECEYSLVTASGETRWFAARADVVRRDGHGKALRMVGVLRDITRRKRDMQLAAEVQDRWERAVRGTSDGMYEWNLLTGHVWYASRFREIIGYEHEDFPDTFNAFQNVLHADDRTLVLHKIRRHLENQVQLDLRCRVVTRSGSVLWCRMRGQADRDAAGRPLRLSGSISDISAQIEAEEALSRSQDFYGTILDSLPLYVSYLDRDERIVYANRQFQQFFRLPLASTRGQPVGDVIGERRYAAIGPSFRAALDGRMVESQGQFRSPDGQLVDLEGIFVPHFNEAGEVQGCFVAARDVTEKHQLEAELRQSQKMEAVGRLTGGIAHDFNNLLAVIVGNMQLLSRSLRESPRLLHQAETAMKAAMRGADLTRRLLAFARQQVLEPRVVDLGTLIGGMYDLLRRSLTGDIEIRQVCAPLVWPVKIDPGQLENAILNLVINARDAMPQGGAIIVSTRNEIVGAQPVEPSGFNGEGSLQPGEYAVLEVLDTGTGMPPDTLKRVFEPFFTTKDVGKGSGLGLPMVYGFVRQSGGHVRITSTVGKGTTVQLFLPRCPGDIEALPRDAAPSSDMPSGWETILVVEDNAEVRSTAVDILNSLGYRVLEAANGYQALEQFMQHTDIALVFSDVMLPGGLPGPMLVDKLRERRPGLKILMTSAFSESSILHRGMLDGTLQLLTKPYRVEDLARQVRTILDENEEMRSVPA